MFQCQIRESLIALGSKHQPQLLAGMEDMMVRQMSPFQFNLKHHGCLNPPSCFPLHVVLIAT